MNDLQVPDKEEIEDENVPEAQNNNNLNKIEAEENEHE